MRLKYDIYANGKKYRPTQYYEGKMATIEYLYKIESCGKKEFSKFKDLKCSKTYLYTATDPIGIEFSFTNNGGTRIRHIYELVK